VTDGPREVMTKKCPTCGGDGIVISEGTAALDVERRLRALATGSRSQAYRVEVNAKIASLLIGPGAERLVELEAQTRRRFYLVGNEDVHLDHFLVLAEGKRDDLAVKAPVEDGAEIELKLGEVGLHDSDAGVGKLDGYDVCVANASRLVGKRVKVRVERVLDGTAYATLLDGVEPADAPITAESEAEKPTRAARKTKAVEETDEEEKPKRKTRRGSRGGRGRKKKTAAPAATAANGAGEMKQVAKIHVPDPELGAPSEDAVAEPATDEPEPASEDGAEAKPRKKTRRGTRGGRNRRKKTAAASTTTTAPQTEWEYVPMSEWGDDVLSDE
jgi:ribonuclease G